MKNTAQRVLGFTLVELLVVVAVIGVLMVAVLSAINPIEQIRKASDTKKKSDGVGFLSSLERFYATAGCYPWEISTTGGCTTSAAALGVPVTLYSLKTGNTASTTGCTLASCIMNELLAKNEIKKEFLARGDVGEDWRNIWVTKDADDVMHACFWPESKAFQVLAKARGLVRTGAQAACTSPGTETSPTSCHTCLPE